VEVMLARVHGVWVLVIVLMVLVIAGCSDDPELRNRDVSGALPDLEFTLEQAPDEQVVTEEDFEGNVVALFFGFTHCPDYCPLTLAKFAGALEGIEGDLGRDMRVLFVSVDPERDTPEQLARYVSGFGERFVGLRADRSTLRDLTRRYRTTFSYGDPDENGHYDVSHGTATFVFDRNGEVRFLARDDVPIDDLEHDLRLLLEQ
jgi:protein SCO1